MFTLGVTATKEQLHAEIVRRQAAGLPPPVFRSPEDVRQEQIRAQAPVPSVTITASPLRPADSTVLHRQPAEQVWTVVQTEAESDYQTEGGEGAGLGKSKFKKLKKKIGKGAKKLGKGVAKVSTKLFRATPIGYLTSKKGKKLIKKTGKAIGKGGKAIGKLAEKAVKANIGILTTPFRLMTGIKFGSKRVKGGGEEQAQEAPAEETAIEQVEQSPEELSPDIDSGEEVSVDNYPTSQPSQSGGEGYESPTPSYDQGEEISDEVGEETGLEPTEETSDAEIVDPEVVEAPPEEQAITQEEVSTDISEEAINTTALAVGGMFLADSMGVPPLLASVATAAISRAGMARIFRRRRRRPMYSRGMSSNGLGVLPFAAIFAGAKAGAKALKKLKKKKGGAPAPAPVKAAAKAPAPSKKLPQWALPAMIGGGALLLVLTMSGGSESRGITVVK